MTVLCPCDKAETYACVEAAINYEGPVYLRFGRFGSPAVYEEGKACLEIGKGNVVKDGSDVTIIAVGDMVSESIKAAEMLAEKGISAAVIDMASIKPIDEDLIIRYASKTGCIVSAEDHNVMGGLGSAVAEVTSKNNPVPQEYIGVQNIFGRSGEPVDLKKAYAMTYENIAEAAQKAISRKK